MRTNCTLVLTLCVAIGLAAGCSGTSDSSSSEAQYKEEIRLALLGDQASLADRDLPEIQARREATQDGQLNAALYERLLAEKRATVPNLRIEYAIIDAHFYESGGLLHANILAEKKVVVDGSDLSEEGWESVRKTYAASSGRSGTFIDDEHQQVVMANLENHTAVLRDGAWAINPTRMVE